MSGQIRPQLWVMAITVRPAQWLSHQLHTIALVGWKSVRLVSEMSGDMSSGRWENLSAYSLQVDILNANSNFFLPLETVMANFYVST